MVQHVATLKQRTLHEGVMNLINTLSAMNIDVTQMVYDPDKALPAACRQIVGEIVHTESELESMFLRQKTLFRR